MRLSKVYEKGIRVLGPLSLDIPMQGVFALIGRNGAGKTTLVRMLATELMPTSGSAKMNGVDLVANPERIREEIAIVPQEARCIPWITPMQTVISYLMFRGLGYSAARRKAAEALRKLKVYSYRDKPTRTSPEA